MAGMFYSIKEAAGKLKITENELKKLIEQGKLREFRIGSDLLLKTEEVEALAGEKGISVEPEVYAEEQELSIPVAPVPETTEPEAGEIDLGEFELPEIGAMEPESPVLNMSELESLSVGKEVSAPKADVLSMKIDNVTTAQPKAASKKQRSTAKQNVATIRRRQRLSIGQWFLRGLMEDSPGVIILLFLLIGGIIAGCLALGTVLYGML
jgi:excisionase family DNA binding protein